MEKGPLHILWHLLWPGLQGELSQVICMVPLAETKAGAVPHSPPKVQFIKSTKPATHRV